MQYQNEEQVDIRLSEDAIYTARLVEVSPKEIKWIAKKGPNQGQEQRKMLLEWWWELEDVSLADPEYPGLRRVKGSCEAKLTNHPDNRFRNWAEAILQREIPVGESIDTDDLIALQADITITKRANEKDPSRPYDEVDQVLPCANAQEIPF